MGNVTTNQSNNVIPNPKEHRTLQRYTANDGLTFIQFQNIEGIQQKCKLYQKKGNEILFSVPIRKSDYQASQSYNQEIKIQFNERVKLQHPNLISCLGIDTLPPPPQQQNQNSELSTGNSNNNSSLLGTQKEDQDNGNLLNLIYEYNTFSLESLISERLDSNRLFPEDDLLNLAKSILNVLNYLQKQNIPHGDIHPSSIFFNTAGNNFAIYDRDFLCGRCIGMRLAESGKKFSYLSPEQITLMRSGSNIFTTNEMVYKADIFCLGMTLLEAASLKLSQECYDENYSILAPIINERLQFIQNYYSPQFFSYLSLMLEYDVRKRLDPVSLWNKIQRDTSLALPANIQQTMNQQQQQQQQQNKNTIPQFGGEQQRGFSNQKQQQQQFNNQSHQQSLLYQQSIHQQSYSQSIEDQDSFINQGMSKLYIQDNDMSQLYGNSNSIDQPINVQDSAHFRVQLNQSQIQINPNQNSQQRIQYIQGNQINNMNKQPQQQQHQLQFKQQQMQQQPEQFMKNSQLVQQQMPFQGISQLHNQQRGSSINDQQMQQQQQRNRAAQMQQPQPFNQYQQNLQPKQSSSQQQLDFIPQNNQPTNLQNQQQQHFQQQVQQIQQMQGQQGQQGQQNQKMYILNPSNGNQQVPTKEQRSASSYSVSQERLHPSEINQTQSPFIQNPHYEQPSQSVEPNMSQVYQRQGMQRSMQVNQSRKHSMSVFNGNNIHESHPQLEYNPSQILKNLQEQQQEIHAQYKYHFGNEQPAKKQTSPNQQNQKQFTNNNQFITQTNQSSEQQQSSNPTHFETQDMEAIAPENDPNTSTNQIVQSQNVIKLKHPRQTQQQSVDQNISIQILGNNQQQYQLKQSQVQCIPQNQNIPKQQMFSQNQFIASAGVSPLRDNNGKIIQLTQKQLQGDQRMEKDNQVLQSLNIANNKVIQQTHGTQNIVLPQRSQSFIQYVSNQQQAFNQPVGVSQNDIDETINQNQQYQNIRQQQSPQIILRQANPMINQSYIQLDQATGHPLEQQIPYQVIYQPQQIDNINQVLPQNQNLQPQQLIQHQIVNQSQQVYMPQNQNIYNQPIKQQAIGQNKGKNPNLIVLSPEVEQKFQDQVDNIQVTTQVISPAAFRNIAHDNQDIEQDINEQPKRAAATSQVFNQQQQYYLSPIPTNNNNRYQDFQNSNIQIYSTQTKQVLITNNKQNQQSQSVVMDTSQYDIQQQSGNDTSLINNKRVLQNQNQNTLQENQQPSPNYKVQGDVNSQKSPLQNQININSLINENKKATQPQQQQGSTSQILSNKQENGNDQNQQNLSPHSQAPTSNSALKLSLLINNQLSNNSKIQNASKISESQIPQVQSYQPSIDLNERVKQVIARSQAIRKTFE